MTWRLANALLQLRSEVNGNWPQRDKASDGSIGDQSHANRNSDHNPNRWGVVTAIDIDDDLSSDDTIPFKLAEHFRNLARAGFVPLQNGGYIIYFRKIASARDNWAWRDYNGINAHKSHIHVSVGDYPAQFDNTSAWQVRNILTNRPTFPQPQPTPPPAPKDDKMYILIKGKDSPEIWLTDGVTRRQMKDQNEINFMRYALGGTVKSRSDGSPEEWPQEYVDRIARVDVNQVDDTFRWYEANPEDGPLEKLITHLLDEREKNTTSAKSSAKTSSKSS